MTGRRLAAALVLLLGVNAVVGCAVEGTPTWPGARLDRALLSAADFPPGVQYRRLANEHDGRGGPPELVSEPAVCADGLSRIVDGSAERGPGSGAKYVAAYDGARIVVTVLTAALDLDQLAAMAKRCEVYRSYFDDHAETIVMTTTVLAPVRPHSLTYQQTLQFHGTESRLYFTFENMGDWGMSAVAFPTPVPSISVKGTLPQTFLDVTARQAERLG